MKKLILAICLLCSITTSAQKISGEYGGSLKIAYDPTSGDITGYYQNSTGFDQDTKQPRFTCAYFIQGVKMDDIVSLITYYPGEQNEKTIEGLMFILGANSLKFNLVEDHGGCANVESFAGESLTFKRTKPMNWIFIKFVTAEKTYFHTEPKATTKGKAFVLKNDILYVEKVSGNWALCSFYGKKETKGWIKLSDLNVIL